MAHMSVRITKDKRKNYKRLKKSAIALEQFAEINVREKYQLYKDRILLFSIFLPVSILLFFSGAIISAVTGNFRFFILTGLGLILMVVVTVVGATGLERRSVLRFLIETIEEISDKDSLMIKDLFLTPYLGMQRTELIIKRLIKGKSLEEYEIKGELIRRKSKIEPEDADKNIIKTEEVLIKIIRSRCLKCNTLIEGNTKFCTKCGEKL
ncbi:MAG: zinc ribbon domain-containing protein [Firmicutes bacterium]|nr:zinc ribbon domain-containing protein [Bacillota bacterium]